MKIEEDNLLRTSGVSQARLFKTVADLSSLGTRWAGTPGEARAAEYMHREMNKFADAVTVEQFKYPHYTPISSQVSTIGPVKQTFPSLGLEYSKAGVVEGRIVYVGEGREEDFSFLADSGHDMKSEIVLARTNRPYRAAEYAKGREAIGIIVISDSPFGTIRQITSQMGFEEGDNLLEFGTSMPGAIISKQSGEDLLSLLTTGPVEVRLSHESHVDLRASWNVIGLVDGNGNKAEEVIIGAHYDTQLDIEGAWDNGSGCAALLEILRVTARLKPSRSMKFCAFGCEEIGLFGSTHYVIQRSGELNKIFCYLNLDSTSADTCITHELHATEGMLDLALGIIQRYSNWKLTHINKFTPHDHEQDSAEFVKRGVDAIWIHEEGNPFFHTHYDRLDTISPSKLTRATQVALLVFNYLSNCDRSDRPVE